MTFSAAGKGLFAAIMMGFGGLLVTPQAQASVAAPGPEGTWLVEEKDGIFGIAPCPSDSSRLCGRLVGMDYTDAEPEKDIWGRSECGLEIISDMKRRKNGRWHGTILDPRSGRTYQASMWLADANTLKLRGYIGLAIFGETQTWKRVVNPAIGVQCRMKKSD
ncbi:DUF2147 domain-containing protein [Bombella sp. TMW 2.2559]|uniref:DUF2147 domain-containing protein n=1 Tax=Bombella dulcis TaxID=2967339 RepID=A0ABT3WE53_9PROT|nr:DUF2147 domain-containing protein [Bombella dulcis]MCX5615883.1 DUF2147 domain-containing protein [Bombella dulcis]